MKQELDQIIRDLGFTSITELKSHYQRDAHCGFAGLGVLTPSRDTH